MFTMSRKNGKHVNWPSLEVSLRVCKCETRANYTLKSGITHLFLPKSKKANIFQNGGGGHIFYNIMVLAQYSTKVGLDQ